MKGIPNGPQSGFTTSNVDLAENYERFFVPTIGEPMARPLIQQAGLRPGYRVLDVACGTGIVARLAAEKVGPSGTVTGLDIHPGMLEVARQTVGNAGNIEWVQADAQSMPLPDDSYDTVFCQAGLMFVPDKLAALREMRRVLKEGGRVWITTPGPPTEFWLILEEEMTRSFGPQAGGFVAAVFSMGDPQHLKDLLGQSGFREIAVDQRDIQMLAPPAGDFFRQYTSFIPVPGLIEPSSSSALQAMETEVVRRWQPFETTGGLLLEQQPVMATGVK